MKIDGIASSEHLDSSGEVLKIDGHDISDLIEGKGVLNFEHNNDSPEDIIGAIVFAKKIKKKSDCEDERQEMFWDACKVPFVYIIAELFDDEEHPGAVAAAAMIRFYKNRGMKVLAGFSVEGATLDKQDNILKRSVGRRVALTLRPCNKSAISDVYEDPKNKQLVKFMNLNKPISGKAYEVPDIIFSDINKSEHKDKIPGGLSDKKKPSDFDKAKLTEGVKVEMEHTSDRAIATEIAMDHLTEDPNYYQKLKTIEKSDPFLELRSAVSSLKKTLTAGGAGVAPSQLTGGSALTIEDRGLKKKRGLKPETEKKLKAVIGSWDGKSSLKDMIKAALPEVSDNYIDHFANMAEEYTLKKAVNHMEHCDNNNASVAQDNLITGINVFAHEGQERFFATNYAGKPVLVVCCDEDKAKRATKFYEFVSTIFPKYSACVPLTNYLKHMSLAHECAYVQLLPDDHDKNTVMNPKYYEDFRKDSWVLHGFALIDLITGAYQDRTELDTLCGQPPLFLGNTQAFYYDNFGGKPFYLKLIGNEMLHLEAVQLLNSIDAVDLAVYGRYALELNPGEIKTMVNVINRLKTEYHGKTITQLFNIITDGIKNEQN